jgi:hypothetical protein
MKRTPNSTATQPRADLDSGVLESLLHWQREKLKALQRYETLRTKKEKRLEQMQALLDEISANIDRTEQLVKRKV